MRGGFLPAHWGWDRQMVEGNWNSFSALLPPGLLRHLIGWKQPLISWCTFVRHRNWASSSQIQWQWRSLWWTNWFVILTDHLKDLAFSKFYSLCTISDVSPITSVCDMSLNLTCTRIYRPVYLDRILKINFIEDKVLVPHLLSDVIRQDCGSATRIWSSFGARRIAAPPSIRPPKISLLSTKLGKSGT